MCWFIVFCSCAVHVHLVIISMTGVARCTKEPFIRLLLVNYNTLLRCIKEPFIRILLVNYNASVTFDVLHSLDKSKSNLLGLDHYYAQYGYFSEHE